jgi:hypothetical protein
MRARPFLIASLAAISCCLFLAESRAGKQSLALFPPQAVGVEDGARISTLLGQALGETLRERFDVHLATLEQGSDPGKRKQKARSLGVTYVLTGNVTRIGRTASLDITLSPTENPEKGRTVFVTVEAGRSSSEMQGEEGTPALPPAYRMMATEASAKLTHLFFGDGRIGEEGARRKIPSLSGRVSRSRNIPGEVVSLAKGDTDLDGKPEIAAAFPDSIALYRVEGENLIEKARIAEKRRGIIHIDIADLNRNGIGEIIAVRYLSGRAVSDIWEYDGKEYQRIAADIPFFLRAVDLGSDGIVLLGQDSDSLEIYKGPVFRFAVNRNGLGETPKQETPKPVTPMPLPAGTWIYSFVPVNFQGGLRYVALGEGERLLLLDERGVKIWKSIDAVTGTDLFLEAATAGLAGGSKERGVRRLSLPGRLFGADLDGDKNDEIVLVNNIVKVGGFFENLRIYASAEVLCFGQQSDRLALAWRTPQIDTPAMDAFLDVPPGGKSIRIGIASRDKAKILGEFGEWSLYWVR